MLPKLTNKPETEDEKLARIAKKKFNQARFTPETIAFGFRTEFTGRIMDGKFNCGFDNMFSHVFSYTEKMDSMKKFYSGAVFVPSTTDCD